MFYALESKAISAKKIALFNCQKNHTSLGGFLTNARFTSFYLFSLLFVTFVSGLK